MKCGKKLRKQILENKIYAWYSMLFRHDGIVGHSKEIINVCQQNYFKSNYQKYLTEK